MIKKISSTLPTFKEITFHKGMNIVVSEKTIDSTDQNTRNGSGKSSLIEIIHFLLGSSVKKDSIFLIPQLINEDFFMDFTIKDKLYTIKRNGDKRTKIELRTHSNSLVKDELSELPTKQMNLKLLEIFFNENDERISFRSSISYFIRQEISGGFLDARETYKKQNASLKQIIVTFLVGLNPDIPTSWGLLLKKRDEIKQLKVALKKGTFNTVIKSEAELKSTLTLLEEQMHYSQEQIRRFEVLPKYRELEKEANQLTKLINEASNLSQLDEYQLIDIRKSIEEENSTSKITLNDFYEKVNIQLPEMIIKRYEDVQKFHESVIRNRKSYLREEMTDLQNSISNRSSQVEKWSLRKTVIMQTLNNKGALDQYSKLQEELSTIEVDFKGFQNQLELLHSIDNKQQELQEEEKRLQQRLNQDFIDNDELIKKAILSFSHAAKYLYKEHDPAHLLIDKKGKNGITFDISKSDIKSKGINNMMIFCFDMMLMEINCYLERPLDFIIHDSHLFDGVDERQIQLALEYAQKKSDELGFQYITLLNSDVYNSLNNKFEANRVNVNITDADEDGGLFGFRF